MRRTDRGKTWKWNPGVEQTEKKVEKLEAGGEQTDIRHGKKILEVKRQKKDIERGTWRGTDRGKTGKSEAGQKSNHGNRRMEVMRQRSKK